MTPMDQVLIPLLNKIATEQNYEKPKIIINEISSGGANYTSKLYTVIIREETKEDLHLFAKVATIGENFRRKVRVNIFDTERFAYTRLVKIYASLEDEHRVPEEHRLFFTKCYGYDTSLYRETLVFENLLAHGYVPHNRFQSISWEYATSAVRDMAKMHALSFAFSKEYPEEFEKSLEVMKLEFVKGSMDDMMQCSVESALRNVKPENRIKLKRYLEQPRFKNDLNVNMCRPISATAIIHADFRGSNLLHRVRQDGKVDIKIVDLQTLQGGSPVTDLIYFIFTGSDEEFRAKYYEKLVDHYYTELSAAMKRLHLDPEETFSREDFKHELKEKLPFGLTLAVFALPVVTVDSENAPQVNENLELSNFSVENTSDLYAERLNGVVNDYVKWGIL